MTVRVLVVSGEPSGDRLVRAVVRAAPSEWRFSGMVGPTAQAAGVLTRAPQPDAAMGLFDVLSGALALRRASSALLREARGCDVAMLVDFHGFTLPLGRALKAQGTRVVLVSAPQVWAWRPARARSLDACADAIGCLLDFEPEVLRALGVLRAKVVFLGHPAAEAVRERAGDDGRLALFAGSRVREIERLAPTLREAAAVLRARGVVAGAVAAVPPERRAHPFAREMPCVTGVDAARDVLSTARAAVACSGTVTLECALAAVPTVVVYRTDALTAGVGRALVSTPFFALPSVVLGRAVFAELLQDRLSVGALVDAVEASLSPEKQRDLRDASRALRARLSTPEGFAARTLSLLAGALR